ncbi:MAG: hypothetical protein ACI9NQ_002131 [Paracoccaceae bacterium]|jgi:uncharacterized protein (TIGR00266 family)
MQTWHYADQQNRPKQIMEEEILPLVNSGEIEQDTKIWTEGMPAWQPAAEVMPQLFDDDTGADPPPLPPSMESASPTGNQCHEIDYEILGGDMQIVEIELDPGETVVAEAGAMNYLEEDITFEAKMGDGSEANQGMMGKLFSAGKRAMTGESIFMTHFNHGGPSGKRRVAFAAPYPGKIIPINMSEFGGEILCQKDAFLCAAHGTKVSIAFNKKIGAGFFGGEGFILQKLQGDGMAFIHAGGHVIKKELKGETLRLDTGCLVGFSPSIEYDIERAGSLKSMFFGGEGLFLATLRGHGTVYLQSLPFSRMADRILAARGASGKGEGSVLGGLGNLLDGD